MNKSSLIFNSEYTKYWEKSVEKSMDGTFVPGKHEVRYFMSKFAMTSFEKILDLGCSFGRMYTLLNSFSECIYGVDPDLYAINRAKEYKYEILKVGHAESVPFESNIFDFVFCWAAFDAIPHYLGLSEMNRVLKLNGSALITGKSHDYNENDSLALIAEKNAYAKGFPNKFTDLVALIENAKNLGFNIKHLIVFPKRGDFGELNYIQIDPIAFLKKPIKCYEYLMILEKISPLINMRVTELECSISKTALNLGLLEK